MKKSILLFVFVFVLSAIVSAQGYQLPNSGFENWLAGNDSLQYWSTTNATEYGSYNTAFPYAETHSGTYALQLKASAIVSTWNEPETYDTTALAALGNLTTRKGIPFDGTVQPDAFSFWYQYIPNDYPYDHVCSAVLEFYKDGSMIGSITPVEICCDTVDVFTYQESEIFWDSSDVPDSVFLCFASGDPFGLGVVHSQFILDDIQLHYTSGVSEFNNFQDVQLYPSPAQNLLHVNRQEQSGEKYEILNVHGQPLQKGIIEHGTIELSNLDGGVYLLKILDESGRATVIKKFVKQ